MWPSWSPGFVWAFNAWEVEIVSRLFMGWLEVSVDLAKEDKPVWKSAKNGEFMIHSWYEMQEYCDDEHMQ